MIFSLMNESFFYILDKKGEFYLGKDTPQKKFLAAVV